MALKLTPADRDIIDCISSYWDEADAASSSRRDQTTENFDCYHLNQSWAHKIDGQSREFLPLQMMAVEQLSSFLKQGVVELDNWFNVELLNDLTDRRFRPETVKKLLVHQLDQCKFYENFEEGLKLGLLGATMPFKIHVEWVPKPKYMASVNRKTKSMELKLRTDLKAQLKIEPLLHEDLRIDPTGRGLYVIHRMELDWFDVRKMAKTKDNPKGIYDLDVVNALRGKDSSSVLDEAERNRVKGQNTTYKAGRPKVRLKECWGTFLDSKGNIIIENGVATIANDTYLIQPPTKNPFWHQRKPFVIAPLIRVPKSTNHKALMDAPTKLNKAMNEVYNLNLDNGIISAYGIKQIRLDWLEDPSVVADGVKPGMTFAVDPSCPPGAKVLERVDTANMSQEALQMFQLTKNEFNTATLSNDARSGQTNPNAKATEIVESSQTITSQLGGIAEAIEGGCLRPILELAWMTAIQHLEDFDSAEMRKVLGNTDAQILASMSAVERFAGTVNGLTFKVYGISYTLNKMRDFRRLTALLQTVFANPVLAEQYMRKYDVGNLLEEIMRSLDIEVDKLRPDQEKLAQAAMARLLTGGGQEGQGLGAGPDIASQIPSVNGARAGATGGGGPAPGVPATNFPPSRATPTGSAGGPGTPSGGIA